MPDQYTPTTEACFERTLKVGACSPATASPTEPGTRGDEDQEPAFQARLECIEIDAAKVPLWNRIKAKLVVSSSGCWEWQGALGNGYGQIKIGGSKGRAFLVHRVVYEMLIGPIPEELEIDHLCRVRSCANPHHMEPVTSRVNTMRGLNPAIAGARQSAKTHCPHGHPYDSTNTRIYRNPAGYIFRQCWTCRRAESNKRRGRKCGA